MITFFASKPRHISSSCSTRLGFTLLDTTSATIREQVSGVAKSPFLAYKRYEKDCNVITDCNLQLFNIPSCTSKTKITSQQIYRQGLMINPNNNYETLSDSRTYYKNRNVSH